MSFLTDLFGGSSGTPPANGANAGATPAPPAPAPGTPKKSNLVYWIVGGVIVAGLVAWGIYELVKKDKPA